MRKTTAKSANFSPARRRPRTAAGLRRRVRTPKGFRGEPRGLFRALRPEPRTRVGRRVLAAPGGRRAEDRPPYPRFMGSLHDRLVAHRGHEPHSAVVPGCEFGRRLAARTFHAYPVLCQRRPLRLTESRSGARVCDPQHANDSQPDKHGTFDGRDARRTRRPEACATRFVGSLDLRQWTRIGTLNPLGRARLLPSPNFHPKIRAPQERRPTRFMGSLLSRSRMQWDHEPETEALIPALSRPTGEGVRRTGEGWFRECARPLPRLLRLTEPRSADARFMERRFGSPARGAGGAVRRFGRTPVGRALFGRGRISRDRGFRAAARRERRSRGVRRRAASVRAPPPLPPSSGRRSNAA